MSLHSLERDPHQKSEQLGLINSLLLAPSVSGRVPLPSLLTAPHISLSLLEKKNNVVAALSLHLNQSLHLIIASPIVSCVVLQSGSRESLNLRFVYYRSCEHMWFAALATLDFAWLAAVSRVLLRKGDRVTWNHLCPTGLSTDAARHRSCCHTWHMHITWSLLHGWDESCLSILFFLYSKTYILCAFYHVFFVCHKNLN